MIEQQHSFDFTLAKRLHLDYLLYLPSRYQDVGQERFPLILFLHGSGERGSDLSLVKKIGLPQALDGRPDFPFIVLAPQCPAESNWVFLMDDLMALLESTVAALRVDTTRLYLTGLSLGGHGTWYIAQAYPNRFAAIAPICGRGTGSSSIQKIKDTPIWVFHGGRDPVVPVEESERMVKALQPINPNVKLTIYPDLEHDSWTRTYNDPTLYEWFLSYQLA